MTLTKLARYQYLIYLSVKNNCDIRESCNLLISENKYITNITPSKIFSADKTNCNNIYNSKDSFVYSFFQNITVQFIDSEPYVELDDKQVSIFNNIKLVTTINKSIFDGEKSIFGKIKKNIREKYPKVPTTNVNREILSNGKNLVANYSFEYNNQIRILSYDRFTYNDFFIDNNVIENIEMSKKIQLIIKDSDSYDILIKFNKNLIEDVIEKIIEIKEKNGL